MRRWQDLIKAEMRDHRRKLDEAVFEIPKDKRSNIRTAMHVSNKAKTEESTPDHRKEQRHSPRRKRAARSRIQIEAHALAATCTS